jgi:hypothetical protein
VCVCISQGRSQAFRSNYCRDELLSGVCVCVLSVCVFLRAEARPSNTMAAGIQFCLTRVFMCVCVCVCVCVCLCVCVRVRACAFV